MQIQINERKKLVIFWLVHSESADPVCKAVLDLCIPVWKEKGYTPVVFHSGNDDLFDTTFSLLKHNRKESARTMTGTPDK